MYKPLPKSVAIRVSPIHGYGLFAIADILYGTDLGVSHVFAVGFKDNYIRTPLGGFINHSNTANCYKIPSHEDSALAYYSLQTIKDIKEGEELTVSYTIYPVKELLCPEVDDNTSREEMELAVQNAAKKLLYSKNRML